MSSLDPYISGKEVSLTHSNGHRTEAKVIKSFSRTLSCVLLVQLNSSTIPCVLKLYDRRFSEQMRKDAHVELWNHQLEQHYQDFVRSGQQVALFDRWDAGFAKDSWYEDDTCETWDKDTDEAYLQHRCRHIFDTEKHAYELMQDLQGICVPSLLGEVALTGPDISNVHLACPGLLLQYIEGISLEDAATHLNRQHWQSTGEQAVSIVNRIGDRGICNRDVQLRSFIVCQNQAVFMVDFGLCVFRDRFRDDEEFRSRQAYEDEEGRLGVVMQHRLRGGFSYHRSEKAYRLIFDFNGEPTEPDTRTFEEFLKDAREYDARRVEKYKADAEKAQQQKAEAQGVEKQKAEARKAEEQQVEVRKAEDEKAEVQKAEDQQAEVQKAEDQQAEEQKADEQEGDEQKAGRQRAAYQWLEDQTPEEQSKQTQRVEHRLRRRRTW